MVIAARRSEGTPMNPRQLATHGPVIPVIVIKRLEDAVPLAEALVAGGIRVLEVTMRTPIALKAIEAIADSVPDAIVGAGTVRSGADAEAASRAGAVFAVSPGYTLELSAACARVGLPLLPGVATASEVMTASADGFRLPQILPRDSRRWRQHVKSFGRAISRH